MRPGEAGTNYKERTVLEKLLTTLQVIIPIFVSIFLGIFAKRRQILTPKETMGLQQFAVKFGLPCVLFNSCLNSDFGPEALTSMGLLLPLMILSSLWSYRLRRSRFPYHNLPLMFSSKESGMLGIPLFLALFGADQAFRMGALDISQAFIAIPTIAILAAAPGDNPSVKNIAKKVLTSPLLLMSLLGLALNLTGAAEYLNQIGVGRILTATTGFLAQPVSAIILFTVGYSFSLSKSNRGPIFRICLIHFAVFSVICLIIQGVLCFLPQVAAETRWAVLLYCMLPPGYLAPGLGRNDEEYTLASCVLSLLTLVTLVVFCILAAVAV